MRQYQGAARIDINVIARIIHPTYLLLAGAPSNKQAHEAQKNYFVHGGDSLFSRQIKAWHAVRRAFFAGRHAVGAACRFRGNKDGQKKASSSGCVWEPEYVRPGR